ncbi:hypothetical protein GC176_25360 [bacterium]|nr:hypothetical protein [bacterium]
MPRNSGMPSSFRQRTRVQSAVRTVALCAALLAETGCSRQFYREQADDQAFSVIGEKTSVGSWTPPGDFSIQPKPESRLFDASPIESPDLPNPVPQLYQYQIPPGFGRRTPDALQSEQAARSRLTEVVLKRAVATGGWRPTRQAGNAIHAQVVEGTFENKLIDRLLLTRYLAQDEAGAERDDVLEVEPVTVPPSAWESIPVECRVRMFEFASVREEYETSFKHAPPVQEQDRSPRLSFDDILGLALLNSREYQTQKEQLYRVALRLTLQRYDYDLKFSPFGNSTGLAFDAQNSSGGAFSTLRTPTQAGMQAMLNTGSSLVARFANDVLLTFGGPDGFAADIGSELMFELTHYVLQNDVRFEQLTQAERNVVYAARDFTHFRRTFYQQLATQYYNLLRTYRQVEIDSQNYFSLVRVYSQRAIELGEGQIPRVQIDQVEQNSLAGRSSLISTCNSLEGAFDQLKVTVGLPTETRINFDLRELDELTLQDEVLVALELVQRVQSDLVTELNHEEPDPASLLNHAGELVDQMRKALTLQRRLDPESAAGDDSDTRLLMTQSQLRVAELRVMTDRVWRQLKADRAEPGLPAWRMPERSFELARAVLTQMEEELAFSRQVSGTESPDSAAIRTSLTELKRQLDITRKLADEVLNDSMLRRLSELNQQAELLIETSRATALQAAAITDVLAQSHGLTLQQTPEQLIAAPLAASRRLLEDRSAALNSIRIDLDDASLAALLLRLDLMTARGQLGDQWRGIKLAADNLRSVLNLSARQRLRSETDSNRATGIDFDVSETELAITFDTPLNRRAQRNAFREQLLNYQRSRRALMELEDQIKQDIRADIRRLRLAEEQHALAIASAALARQRSTSTELQLRLGVGGIKARDFLEAQTAYAASLSAVAARHIEYVLGRIRLYVDLEQLQLNDRGQWAGLRDSEEQPTLAPAAGPGIDYGDLVPNLNYSDELRRGF